MGKLGLVFVGQNFIINTPYHLQLSAASIMPGHENEPWDQVFTGALRENPDFGRLASIIRLECT